MNKREFIQRLKEETTYTIEECTLINDIIEDTFIFTNKGKEKLISKFKDKLSLNDSESNELYDIIMNILKSEIKRKLTHPFMI